MSFSRRRASLACTFCRHRKRRCDSKRPKCSNCREAEAECRYDELPTQRFEPAGSNAEILSKLQGIETLLESHNEAISALFTEIRSLSTTTEAVARSSVNHNSVAPDGAISTSPTNLSGRANAPSPWSYYDPAFQTGTADLPPLTIPAKHNTSSNYLLCLPEMRALIGEYPTNLFFLLESKNPLPPELSFDGWMSPVSPVHIDRDVTDYLVSVFFAEVHPCHPILDQEVFTATYARFLEEGVNVSIDSALCLVVLALGAVASRPHNASKIGTDFPGVQYIQAALPTLISLSTWSFEWHVSIPQALVLASVYFAYVARPLQSWRLVYSASTIMQFKLSRLRVQDSDPSSRESLLRLFWSCFLLECDRLAELELPQSGLQQLTDETSLPSCSNLDESVSTCYLAEISIRRLLNRTHNTLYPHKHDIAFLSSTATTLSPSDDFLTRDISSVRAICDELHRQLDLWYCSIPEHFRPALGVDPTANYRERVLRIRYYATKHIIYRPFVLHAVIHSASPPTEQVLEKCGICLESCRYYLYNTGDILKQSSQYTWTFSLSSLGAIVVMTLASLCPSLKHFVPDINDLQNLVIDNIEPWASPNSSLQAVISIIKDIRRKQRLLAYI